MESTTNVPNLSSFSLEESFSNEGLDALEGLPPCRSTAGRFLVSWSAGGGLFRLGGDFLGVVPWCSSRKVVGADAAATLPGFGMALGPKVKRSSPDGWLDGVLPLGLPEGGGDVVTSPVTDRIPTPTVLVVVGTAGLLLAPQACGMPHRSKKAIMSVTNCGPAWKWVDLRVHPFLHFPAPCHLRQTSLPRDWGTFSCQVVPSSLRKLAVIWFII